MANLSNLNYTSISLMPWDEGRELIRSIRMNRRIPTRVTKTRKTKKIPTPKVNAEQAAKILELLGGID